LCLSGSFDPPYYGLKGLNSMLLQRAREIERKKKLYYNRPKTH
jgi:hypothetical protein